MLFILNRLRWHRIKNCLTQLLKPKKRQPLLHCWTLVMSEYLLLPEDVNELHLPLESLEQVPELLLLRLQERLAFFRSLRVTFGLLLSLYLVIFSLWTRGGSISVPKESWFKFPGNFCHCSLTPLARGNMNLNPWFLILRNRPTFTLQIGLSVVA